MTVNAIISYEIITKIPASVVNALISDLIPLGRLLCFTHCNTFSQVAVFHLSKLERFFGLVNDFKSYA